MPLDETLPVRVRPIRLRESPGPLNMVEIIRASGVAASVEGGEGGSTVIVRTEEARERLLRVLRGRRIDVLEDEGGETRGRA